MPEAEQQEPTRGAVEHLNAVAGAFREEESPATALDRMRLRVKRVHTAFVLGEQAQVARQLGPVFWLPVERANEVFLHAYSALFCIPAFALEGLARQADRFSIERLPNTIRTTSAFVLDAFGYDRRTDRHRDEMYWPSPAIRMAHAARVPEKARISEAAMAYFAWQLVRAAEYLAPTRGLEEFAQQCEMHFAFFGEFLRRAEYPFSQRREQLEAFAEQVDEQLAGSECAELLTHVLAVAPGMGVELTTASLEAFLPTYSAQVVARALVEPSNPPTVEPQTIAIEIEYCVRCAYREPAVRLVDALLEKLGQNMKSVALLPSDGGRFEVLLNGELVFSGLRRGRPPTLEEVTALLGL